jgi:sugar lactone lactonase YvrE
MKNKINILPGIRHKALAWLAFSAILLSISLVFSCKDDEDEQPNLTVTAISPISGRVGSVVEISGTGFSETVLSNTITLNGKLCAVASATSTKVTVTVPLDAESGIFRIAVGKKTAESSTFTVVPLAVTAISPTSGGVGTFVQITGTGFSATASENAVTLNGKVCPITNATITNLTVTIPAEAASGNLTVAVSGKAVQSATFTFIPEVTITSISPTTGSVGALVEIIGTGFSSTASENAVTLNTRVCQVVMATTTKLTISIPAESSTGSITVTVGTKSAQSGTFTVIPGVPTLAITSISPNNGAKNTAVTITGTGFSATVLENQVTLNGKICPVTSATTTSLTITIPAEAGSGNIMIAVGGNAAQSDLFTFIPDPLAITSISPTTGAKNTVVTITGTGFSATTSENAVTLNTKPCPVVTATTTTLTITIPAEAGSGNIKLVVGGSSVESDPFTFIRDPLAISSISPNSGTKNTVVTITGTGFSSTVLENAVTLNGKVCPVTSATTTTLTISIPAEAGSGNILVTVGGNSAQSGTFTFIADAPTITSISPTSGAKNTVVTIIGTGFSTTPSQNSVTINNKVCPVTAATATSLTVTIPAAAGTGNLVVSVSGGPAAQSGTFTFIPLAVTSISPTSGPKNTVVTVVGTGFSATPANNAVTLNNKVCAVTSATETELTITIPASAGSGLLKINVSGEVVDSQNFDFVFTTTVSTFAGSGQDLSDDGTGTSANIARPRGAVFDASGNLFVTDSYHRIRKITPSGVVTTFAGSGYGDANGTGTAAEFKKPVGLAIDGSGNLYVAEEEGRRIRKITPAGVVTTLAGSGDYDFAEGNGTAAKFRNPTGVAVDASGNVFVADSENHRIRKITPSGDVTTFAGSSDGFADGNAASAQFKKPFDLVFDASGNLYVSDGDNHKIRKITPSGDVTTFAGSTYGFNDGSANTAQFQFIKGIAIDGNGNFYLADENSQRIRKIIPTGVVSTLAGNGSDGYTDGTGSTAQFNYPFAVAVDGSGNVYVADKDNHRIRKITID